MYIYIYMYMCIYIYIYIYIRVPCATSHLTYYSALSSKQGSQKVRFLRALLSSQDLNITSSTPESHKLYHHHPTLTFNTKCQIF